MNGLVYVSRGVKVIERKENTQYAEEWRCDQRGQTCPARVKEKDETRTGDLPDVKPLVCLFM